MIYLILYIAFFRNYSVCLIYKMNSPADSSAPVASASASVVANVLPVVPANIVLEIFEYPDNTEDLPFPPLFFPTPTNEVVAKEYVVKPLFLIEEETEEAVDCNMGICEAGIETDKKFRYVNSCGCSFRMCKCCVLTYAESQRNKKTDFHTKNIYDKCPQCKRIKFYSNALDLVDKMAVNKIPITPNQIAIYLKELEIYKFCADNAFYFNHRCKDVPYADKPITQLIYLELCDYIESMVNPVNEITEDIELQYYICNENGVPIDWDNYEPVSFLDAEYMVNNKFYAVIRDEEAHRYFMIDITYSTYDTLVECVSNAIEENTNQFSPSIVFDYFISERWVNLFGSYENPVFQSIIEHNETGILEEMLGDDYHSIAVQLIDDDAVNGDDIGQYLGCDDACELAQLRGNANAPLFEAKLYRGHTGNGTYLHSKSKM